MTLKKYVIVYFIILLLNLAVVNVVIAQEGEGKSKSTALPSSAAGKSASPSSTLSSSEPEPSNESGPESCLNGNACRGANETLGLCDGIIKPPSQYIEEGVRNGTYGPDQGLTKCMCNTPYYNNLTACIQCFANETKEPFGVYPLDEYKSMCKDLGTTYTETLPNIPPKGSGIPKKIRLGIVIGITVVIVSLVGIALLKYTRKKRRVAEQSAFASKLSAEITESGHRLSTGDIFTTSYPPPSSTSPHYPPPPTSTGAYQSYASPPPPPPSNTSNAPTSQSTSPYYPPPGEYRSPRGDKGSGESDSYFKGNF